MYDVITFSEVYDFVNSSYIEYHEGICAKKLNYHPN